MKPETRFPHTLERWVFANRNRAYGAFFLRGRIPGHTLLGFGTACLLLFLLIGVPRVVGEFMPAPAAVGMNAPLEDEWIVHTTPVELPQQPEVSEPEPQTPASPPPAAKPEINYASARVVPHEDALMESTIASLDSLAGPAEVGIQDRAGKADAPPSLGREVAGSRGETTVPAKEVKQMAEPKPNDFMYVDKLPSAINLNEIRQRVQYPQICKDAGIDGLVHIKLLIDEEGQPIRYKLVKSPHDLLTREVIPQAMALRFTPAVLKGKPVKYWITVPFHFQLK